MGDLGHTQTHTHNLIVFPFHSFLSVSFLYFVFCKHLQISKQTIFNTPIPWKLFESN